MPTISSLMTTILATSIFGVPNPSLFTSPSDSTVGIYYGSQFICTGVFISKDVVITSYDCIGNKDLSQVFVKPESQNVADAPLLSITNEQTHYRNFRGSNSVNYGVSLLVLQSPFENAEPLCLSNHTSLNTDIMYSDVKGLFFEENFYHANPQKPYVRTFSSHHKVMQLVSLSSEISNQLDICKEEETTCVLASDYSIEKYDMCMAEQGSPLRTESRNGKVIITGILNYAINWAYQNRELANSLTHSCTKALVYVNLDSFMGWLKNMVPEVCIV